MTEYPDWLTSPGEQPFYTEFYAVVNQWYKDNEGYDLFQHLLGVEFQAYPDRYVQMPDHMAEIIDRFNVKYGFREIGAESYEAFEANLRRRIQEVTTQYENRFLAYSKLEDVNDTNIAGGDNSKVTYQDTPTGQLEGSYATNITESESSRHETEGTPLDATNLNMERFRYLVMDYVDQFEVCFMDTVGLM